MRGWDWAPALALCLWAVMVSGGGGVPPGSEQDLLTIIDERCPLASAFKLCAPMLRCAERRQGLKDFGRRAQVPLIEFLERQRGSASNGHAEGRVSVKTGLLPREPLPTSLPAGAGWEEYDGVAARLPELVRAKQGTDALKKAVLALGTPSVASLTDGELARAHIILCYLIAAWMYHGTTVYGDGAEAPDLDVPKHITDLQSEVANKLGRLPGVDPTIPGHQFSWADMFTMNYRFKKNDHYEYTYENLEPLVSFTGSECERAFIINVVLASYKFRDVIRYMEEAYKRMEVVIPLLQLGSSRTMEDYHDLGRYFGTFDLAFTFNKMEDAIRSLSDELDVLNPTTCPMVEWWNEVGVWAQSPPPNVGPNGLQYVVVHAIDAFIRRPSRSGDLARAVSDNINALLPAHREFLDAIAASLDPTAMVQLLAKQEADLYKVTANKNFILAVNAFNGIVHAHRAWLQKHMVKAQAYITEGLRNGKPRNTSGGTTRKSDVRNINHGGGGDVVLQESDEKILKGINDGYVEALGGGKIPSAGTSAEQLQCTGVERSSMALALSSILQQGVKEREGSGTEALTRMRYKATELPGGMYRVHVWKETNAVKDRWSLRYFDPLSAIKLVPFAYQGDWTAMAKRLGMGWSKMLKHSNAQFLTRSGIAASDQCVVEHPLMTGVPSFHALAARSNDDQIDNLDLLALMDPRPITSRQIGKIYSAIKDIDGCPAAPELSQDMDWGDVLDTLGAACFKGLDLLDIAVTVRPRQFSIVGVGENDSAHLIIRPVKYTRGDKIKEGLFSRMLREQPEGEILVDETQKFTWLNINRPGAGPLRRFGSLLNGCVDFTELIQRTPSGSFDPQATRVKVNKLSVRESRSSDSILGMEFSEMSRDTYSKHLRGDTDGLRNDAEPAPAHADSQYQVYLFAQGSSWRSMDGLLDILCRQPLAKNVEVAHGFKAHLVILASDLEGIVDHDVLVETVRGCQRTKVETHDGDNPLMVVTLLLSRVFDGPMCDKVRSSLPYSIRVHCKPRAMFNLRGYAFFRRWATHGDVFRQATEEAQKWRRNGKIIHQKENDSCIELGGLTEVVTMKSVSSVPMFAIVGSLNFGREIRRAFVLRNSLKYASAMHQSGHRGMSVGKFRRLAGNYRLIIRAMQDSDRWVEELYGGIREDGHDKYHLGSEMTCEQMERLGKDNNACLVAWNGQVFDITRYISLRQHPGSTEALKEYCGRDMSEAFAMAGHSTAAADLLQQYIIGPLTTPEYAPDYQRVLQNFERAPDCKPLMVTGWASMVEHGYWGRNVGDFDCPDVPVVVVVSPSVFFIQTSRPGNDAAGVFFPDIYWMERIRVVTDDLLEITLRIEGRTNHIKTSYVKISVVLDDTSLYTTNQVKNHLLVCGIGEPLGKNVNLHKLGRVVESDPESNFQKMRRKASSCSLCTSIAADIWNDDSKFFKLDCDNDKYQGSDRVDCKYILDTLVLDIEKMANLYSMKLALGISNSPDICSTLGIVFESEMVGDRDIRRELCDKVFNHGLPDWSSGTVCKQTLPLNKKVFRECYGTFLDMVYGVYVSDVDKLYGSRAIDRERMSASPYKFSRDLGNPSASADWCFDKNMC